MPTGFYEPHATGVAGYVYKADTYCPSCTLEILLAERGIEGHGLSHVCSGAIDRLGISQFGGERYHGGEHNWDSDDFPKVILRPSDPEHCGKCREEF